jgi:hypothetical protein
MPNEKKTLPHITLKNASPPYDEQDGDYGYFRRSAENPFRHDARAFELVNAWWLCEAATLAYSDSANVHPVFQRTTLDNVRDFDAPGSTQCFVASNDDFAIVAFRGTEITPHDADGRRDFRDVFADVRTDARFKLTDFPLGGQVHGGFSSAVEKIWNDAGLADFVESLPSRTIWFTGHSLGAALATLAAVKSRRLDGLYTFGSPRVGDSAFAEAFTRLLSNKGVEHFRFVNNRDVVATIPPRGFYKHVGTLKHFDAHGRIREDSSLFEELVNEVRSVLPLDEGQGIDPHFFNLVPNAVEDHVPTLYATHIWNAYVDESST